MAVQWEEQNLQQHVLNYITRNTHRLGASASPGKSQELQTLRPHLRPIESKIQWCRAQAFPFPKKIPDNDGCSLRTSVPRERYLGHW